LAAAREIWEECKARGKVPANHPARWALAEIENLHDPAIRVEPIHRIVFNTELDEMLTVLSRLPGFSKRDLDGAAGLSEAVNGADSGSGSPAPANRLGLAGGGRHVLVETSSRGIVAAALQPLLDLFIRDGAKRDNQPSVDYIHGEEELFRLVSLRPEHAVGILMPPISKDALFETVARTGPLPRKTFSMGEACEKRFYLECRRLFD
jgi:hypothetical protein